MACPPAFSNKRLLLWGETWRTRHRRNQSSIASWSPHLGAAGKCEHWRSIDLADLRRMGLLKPIVGNRIRAITWKNDRGGFDKLGIIPSARGIQFAKRDDQGKLAGL